MSKRKVSFDCAGLGSSDEEWLQIAKRLDATLLEAGLPSLYSNAWDDIEGGCSFEGTKEEVDSVKEILLHLGIVIREESYSAEST